MDEPAADPKWKERLLQTRTDTKKDYFSWCGVIADDFMEFARLYEERGDEVAAMRAQRIAKVFRKEMEKILRDE